MNEKFRMNAGKFRRVAVIAVLLTAVMAMLCGCAGGDKLYGGYTATDVEMQVKQMAYQYISSVGQIPDEELEAAKEQYGEEVVAPFIAFKQNAEELGEFKDFGDFAIEQTGKTYTTTLNLKYEERDAIMTVVYKKHNMEMESLNVEPVYTVKEKMSKAGLNTLMGIGTVFVILILISLVIYAFGLIGKIEERKKEEIKENLSSEPRVTFGTIEVPEVDDLELIAVITAAIAASTGKATDDFVVRTIRRR